MKLSSSNSAALLSAALGAALGVSSAYLSRRKPGYGLLLGAVLGGSLAYGAVRSGPGAVQKVNAYRDARWLSKNPICYA